MPTDLALTTEFEAHRSHLRGVAYRMLGSLDEADDAVQQAWVRAEGADLAGVVNLGGWLTTVVSRICLDLLRARRSRGERPLPAMVERLPATGARGEGDPAAEAELAESVGAALLVVLDRLSPDERVAFVLHDLFAVPFEDVAPVVGRTPSTAKKLASRARARVRADDGARRDPVLVDHGRIVEAFRLAAAGGDLRALVQLLAPDVVRRADRALPGGPHVTRGFDAVVEETVRYGAGAREGAVALVDGAPAIVIPRHGRLGRVIRVAVTNGRIASYDVIGEPERLAALDIRIW